MVFELGTHGDRAGFEKHVDALADALAEVPDVDGDVGANLDTGRVELCMTLPADNRVDALGKAVVAARTAIHTAGGQTPGWEGYLVKLLDNEEYALASAPADWSVLTA